MALYDYPETATHPAFNLALRVNFVNGSGETYGFRFVGSEGVISIDDGVTVSKQPRESEPGYTIDTFPKTVQEDFLKKYREKYPRSASPLMASVLRRRSVTGRRAGTAIIGNITASSWNRFDLANLLSRTPPLVYAPQDRRSYR